MILAPKLTPPATVRVERGVYAPTAAPKVVIPVPVVVTLKLLVCPVTKTRLQYDAEKQELISRAAGLAYPIRDGIPIMLADEAREINRE